MLLPGLGDAGDRLFGYLSRPDREAQATSSSEEENEVKKRKI